MIKYLCDLEDPSAEAVCKIKLIVSSPTDDRAHAQFEKHLCAKHAEQLGAILGSDGEAAFRPYMPKDEEEHWEEPEPEA